MTPRIEYADDDRESVGELLRLRLPSLLTGLILGLSLSFVTSRFEEVLSRNVQIAYFIPFIVYMADSVGTQTQNIYARDLRSGKASFKKYFIKENILGVILGIIFSAITIPITLLWFKSTDLAITVGFSTMGAVASAPVIALAVTELLELEHTDPAVGAGPLATVIQDTISVVIYGLIASSIML